MLFVGRRAAYATCKTRISVGSMEGAFVAEEHAATHRCTLAKARGGTMHEPMEDVAIAT